MKRILLIFLCLTIMFPLTACNNKEKTIVEENNTNENVQIFENQVVGNIILKNHNISYHDNVSHVSVMVSNENNTEVNIPNLYINYYRDDVLVYTATETIGTIGINGVYMIDMLVDLNLASCDKVTYEIIK